jgi:hypothetical protein
MTEKLRNELLIKLRTTMNRFSWNHKIQNTNTEYNEVFDCRVRRYLFQNCGKFNLHSHDYSDIHFLPHRRTNASRKSAVGYICCRQMQSWVEIEDRSWRTRSSDVSTEPSKLDRERGKWRRRNGIARIALARLRSLLRSKIPSQGLRAGNGSPRNGWNCNSINNKEIKRLFLRHCPS